LNERPISRPGLELNKMKVLVASPEKKDKASRERRELIVRALENLKVILLNPLPGRPPIKLKNPTLFPYLTYEKEAGDLKKADLVVADLTETDFKTGFLISQALFEGKPVLGLFWQSITKEKLGDWNENDEFYIESFDKENILLVLRRFFRFLQQKGRRHGKLIVIDGTDGSGKATQAKLLLEYLKKAGLRTKYIDFPRYYASFHGGMVGRYLKGEFGGLSEVNPYLASLTYALDRLTAKEDLEEWLKNGNLIVANRYICSNLAHQTARVKPEEREKFIDWIMEMEYKVHKLPKEEIVIFLHVPASLGAKLVEKKDKRSYTGGKSRDIAEADLHHQKETEKMYLYLTKRFPHWIKIECLNSQGQILPPEQIHQKIVTMLREKGIISL